MVAKGEYQKVLEAVIAWPTADRFALATDLLASLREQRDAPRDTLSKAIGLLRNSNPPPTDAQVDQWMDEQRIEKYGKS